jgi:DNA-directed RNA polymerase specialized sigma24 family protein
MLKAMRGVKNSNLVWLHYYEGYEVRELADTFQMKESEVRAAMESAASTVRRKFMMKPQGAWNET